MFINAGMTSFPHYLPLSPCDPILIGSSSQVILTIGTSGAPLYHTRTRSRRDPNSTTLPMPLVPGLSNSGVSRAAAASYSRASFEPDDRVISRFLKVIPLMTKVLSRDTKSRPVQTSDPGLPCRLEAGAPSCKRRQRRKEERTTSWD
ncbi:hypothetical protein F4782DRAFT_513404 [Xylaria castorea]|nr:hypothetical protein F4782DRAFT_513404 [Xylaria castorea]